MCRLNSKNADFDQMSDDDWCAKYIELLRLSEAVGKLFDEDRAVQGFQQTLSQFGFRRGALTIKPVRLGILGICSGM
jgi:hypothetical protein